MMKIILIISLLILSLAACHTRKSAETSEEITPNESDASDPTGKKQVEAKVIYVPFENKAGRLIEGVGDYFLVYENMEWFVKFDCSEGVNPEDLKPLIDQMVKFSLTEREGQWDSDDPNVQSRIGKYVCIHSFER